MLDNNILEGKEERAENRETESRRTMKERKQQEDNEKYQEAMRRTE